MGDEAVDVTLKPDSPEPGQEQQQRQLHLLCARAEVGEADLQELQELLDAGADPNVVDSFNRAPLSLLCMNDGHVDAAKALLAAGALSSSQDAWGRTSLHWCCDRGWLTIAELLLARGAPVNACTKQGDTPLLWAAKSGHVKLVELLLKSGADPLLRNNRDEAALDVSDDEDVRALISFFTAAAASAGEKLPASTGTAAASILKAAEDTQTSTQKSSVQDLKEKAPVVSCETDLTPKADLGSRALAGLPMGGQVGASGGPLFSAYKKQPMSSSAGSGSGPGPKKMKITLKKK